MKSVDEMLINGRLCDKVDKKKVFVNVFLFKILLEVIKDCFLIVDS